MKLMEGKNPFQMPMNINTSEMNIKPTQKGGKAKVNI